MTGAQPQGGFVAAAAPARFTIDGEFTIYRAEELKQALLDALPAGATLDCDLADVTEFDSAGVQLLLLAAREARLRSGELRLVGLSAAVVEVFELLNLAAHFDVAAVGAPARC